MPASRGTVPARALGRQCRKCGADEWKHYSGKTCCWPCSKRRRRTALARQERRDPALRLYHSAKARAAKAGTEFGITLDDVRAAWPRDNRCPALGMVLRQGKGTLTDASPTLDRVNPAWGYMPGNIAVISYAANRAKGAMSAAELGQIATWMRATGLA